jgi:hypothetical protein
VTPKTFRSVRERRGLGLNLDYVTRSISSIVDEREVDITTGVWKIMSARNSEVITSPRKSTAAHSMTYNPTFRLRIMAAWSYLVHRLRYEKCYKCNHANRSSAVYFQQCGALMRERPQKVLVLRRSPSLALRRRVTAVTMSDTPYVYLSGAAF